MMLSEHVVDVARDALKVTPTAAYVGSSWAGVQWSTLASAAAFIYSALMIADFLWRKAIRPLLERKNVIPPKP